jgi:hypothetical protein
VVDGRRTAAEALVRYRDFSAAHGWKFRSMLQAQRLIPRVPPRVLSAALVAMESRRFVDWSFGHYLRIAPPEFAAGGPPRIPLRSADRAAA